MPFFVEGQELSETQAGMLLSLIVVFGIFVAPIMGAVVSKYPFRRSVIVMIVAIVILLAWLMVIVPSTPRPLWQLVLFSAALSLGGPASGIGHDFARTSHPKRRLGVGTGVSNMGGFMGGFLAILVIGVILDWIAPTGEYQLNDFRIAFSSLLVFWVIGVVGLWVSRVYTLREYRKRGIYVAPLKDAIRSHWSARP